jgi:hypothetical protein
MGQRGVGDDSTRGVGEEKERVNRRGSSGMSQGIADELIGEGEQECRVGRIGHRIAEQHGVRQLLPDTLNTNVPWDDGTGVGRERGRRGASDGYGVGRWRAGEQKVERGE